MSAPAPESGEQQPTGGNSGYTPPATQEDFNRIINERVTRERNKFADYDDLKGKAERYDTDIAAAQEKAKTAEAAASAIPTQVANVLKTHLVALHEIDAEDAELFLTATDPELLLKQVSKLTARGSGKKTNHVPREGNTPPPNSDPARETVRGLFGG